jgi:hypothetical protein
MIDGFDDMTRQRAYAIWEREGRPDGQHESQWKASLSRHASNVTYRQVPDRTVLRACRCDIH